MMRRQRRWRWQQQPGFTLLEVVVGVAIITIFLLPLARHFTSIRRVSLSARDSVMATSLLNSCLAELQSLPYDDLDRNAQKFKDVCQSWASRVVASTTFATTIVLSPSSSPRLKVLDLETKFRHPGVADTVDKRVANLRGFVFDRRP